MKNRWFRIIIVVLTCILFQTFSLELQAKAKISVNVFAASSLYDVLTDLEEKYEDAHPEVDLLLNTDSSGVLMTQILEGAPCDIFFSADEKQMNQLEAENMVIEGTRVELLSNQLVLITQIDTDSKVKELKDLEKAESLALADGSVPAGKYTRQAMMAEGLIQKKENPEAITTLEISKQFNNLEISEQSNVQKVLQTVAEGACEVGTVYASDTVAYSSKIKIIEKIDNDLTGKILYPIARIQNPDADHAQEEAAENLMTFLTNEDALSVYQQYGFLTETEDGEE